MKIISLRTLVIIISIGLIIGIGSYVTGIFTKAQNRTEQPEKIFLYPYFSYEDNTPRYIKLSDLQTNSWGRFMYPSSYKMESDNAYQSFLLIRLPLWMGGASDDVSSLRAYSEVDLTSHCLVQYRPQDDMVMEDPCSGDRYRILDGYLYAVGPDVLRQGNALPRLDLYKDKDGYLYVLPPTWEVSKNGVVGIGREISSNEIQNNTLFLSKLKKSSDVKLAPKLPIPLQLVSGENASISQQDENKWMVTYDKYPIGLIVEYCNCINYKSILMSYSRLSSELWGLNDTYILSTPRQNGIYGPSDYIFEFFKDKFKITLITDGSFETGMKIALDNFFNKTSLSKLQKIPIN